MFGTNLHIPLPDGQMPVSGSAISPTRVQLNCSLPYANYPVRSWQQDDCRIHWEGHCYIDEALFQQHWQALQLCLQKSDVGGLEKVIQQLQQGSGEFACWMVNKQGVWFFNDTLGRLPVYHFADSQHFFVGRNLQHFFQLCPKQPDELAIAQTLWCGYALGERTLFENVHRVAGGTILYFSFEQARSEYRAQHTFDCTPRNNQSLEQNATQLTQCFIDACTQLVQSTCQPFHISLSGGQDSRAVLAGFSKAASQLSASSFAFADEDADANMAALLAEKMRVPWQRIALQNDAVSDDWLLKTKSGLNYSGMAFIEPYLRSVAETHSGAILLTGDGGDKVLPFLGEVKPPSTIDHLVQLLMRRHAILKPELAATLCGLHTDDLNQSVFNRLQLYPEESLQDKSIHFTLFERAAKAYFEGEDRNRFFMWSTTPFYHLEFFRMAMMVPDAQKKNYRLFRHFMQQLAPSLCSVPDATGGTIDNLKFIAGKWVQEKFRSAPTPVKQSLRTIKQKLQPSSTPLPELNTQWPMALEWMSHPLLAKAIKAGGTETAWHLRTIQKTFA